jgi:predicted MarR family transcription regulator
MAAGKKRGIGPIVSSAHLADNAAPELSELEFALTIANNAFQRWIVRGTTAVGMGELGALDVLVLHTVNHRGRPKKLADICLVLNQEDTHVVAYALRSWKSWGSWRARARARRNTPRRRKPGQRCASVTARSARPA